MPSGVGIVGVDKGVDTVFCVTLGRDVTGWDEGSEDVFGRDIDK